MMLAPAAGTVLPPASSTLANKYQPVPVSKSLIGSVIMAEAASHSVATGPQVLVGALPPPPGSSEPLPALGVELLPAMGVELLPAALPEPPLVLELPALPVSS